MPYDQPTKSSSGEKCKAEPVTANDSITKTKASREEVQESYNRLNSTHTKSSSGQPCKADQTAAQDTISPKISEEDAKQIFDRLSREHTKSTLAEECKAKSTQEMAVSRTLPNGDVEQIIERLHTTHTKSSSATACKSQATQASDDISRKDASQEDIDAITKRLMTTHTKSSSGGTECKTSEPLKPPGFGLKMYPAIEGIEERFSGRSKTKKDDVNNIVNRLTSAQTKSSQARLENPRILLYPERTLLCNNVERIGMFQQNGGTVKQKELARREKWFI